MQLKREIRPAHAHLEKFIAAAGLFRTRPGYVAFLKASLAFQAEAERALARSGAEGGIPDWPRRQRAHLGRQDLGPGRSQVTLNNRYTFFVRQHVRTWSSSPCRFKVASPW
jgi:heme oxygenase